MQVDAAETVIHHMIKMHRWFLDWKCATLSTPMSSTQDTCSSVIITTIAYVVVVGGWVAGHQCRGARRTHGQGGLS
jgi:hypothetical protein